MPFLLYSWATATRVGQAQLSSLPMQTLSAAQTAHSSAPELTAVPSVRVSMCNLQTALQTDACYAY